MKKFLFLIVCLLGLSVTLNAQSNNSRETRSINALRQAGCAANFFQGNTWDFYGYVEGIVRCEVAPNVDGSGDVYVIVASYHCTGEICPAIADMIVGRVFWCGNQIVGTECLVQ